MTDKTEISPLPVSMDTKTAAAWLTTQTPHRTVDQWITWLQHNRDTSRYVGWRMPFQKIGARVLYDTEELQRLARISNASVGAAKVLPEDAEWVRANSPKDKPST